MIRPTRRAVLLLAAGIPFSLYLVIADAAAWPYSFVWSGLVLFAMLSDGVACFPASRLALRVDTPHRLYIGEEGTLAVTIGAADYRRPTRFELRPELRGDLEPPGSIAASLLPGTDGTARLPLRPYRRGRILLDALWVRWRGPLSLVERIRRSPLERSIDVVPNVRGVQRAALQFFARESIFGVKVEQRRGAGSEFDALRDYVQGLDSRFIDWKHSARHRKLVCKEFKTERNHPVILAFDTGYLMAEPLGGVPRLDHAINAGLLLGWISLQGGDPVGTYGFDAAIRHFAKPVRGVANFSRLQQATAGLAYQAEETNFTLGLAGLGARLSRRTLIILFTDFVDTVTAELLVESMRRIASRHLVIFVTLRDPLLYDRVDAPPDDFPQIAEAVIAHDLLRDRSIVFERLERLGVHCLETSSKALSVSLINRYLLIKQRGLL